MGCPAGAACLHDHIYPRLRDPRRGGDGRSYRALAPCHDDRSHSLSVSVGANGRVLWHCFACRDAELTRAALIRSGVSPRCLPRVTADAADFEASVSALVFGKGSHPHTVLRVAAMLRGFGDDLPAGEQLRQLAEDCGVSLREAYRARGGHG